ncbi:ABC transporter ATP-binding protein [Simiduia sp. 21SJ11W-1]|uniref:ATP-binding cassette domain-containing protein n=1 Tax=Simiduia sp. 21SJ11W-1 TaxID=2909669 RepID=UPI0020A0176B|nr:ATP-binding cassette domain-containing protein [Simiduia sp. 21SJ11W-1]UTA47047.1 ABC transporter ATP-binding protein [Simiduia sp. 21SJ11W-1]
MLEVSQLSRRYGEYLAVDSVSFSITKGEIVGLLGHNGAGKTTIMKMLSGYLEPDTGSIVVDGLNLAQHTKKIQKALGYLPESLPVYPEMTVADYLDYAADLKGLAGNHKREEIKHAIGATDISAKLNAPIATLSRGFKQRVGVAQAILGRPKLLILDEPSNGLDPEQTLQMRALIRDIAKDATVILSTHIMQEVEALCSRVLLVRAGQLAVDAQLAELQQSHKITLDTNLPLSDRQLLEQLAEVNKVDAAPAEGAADPTPGYRYTLTVNPAANQRALLARIAEKLITAGYQLWSLTPQSRDLESLFNESQDIKNPHQEVNRAA